MTAPLDNLLGRLEGLRQTAPGRWIGRCPAHDDRSPSLGIRETDDGVILLKCWAGCETAAVLAAVGLDFHDLYPLKQAIGDIGRHKSPPRFRAGELIELAAFEAEIIALGAGQLLGGQTLSADDINRLRLAIRTLRAIHAEVVR